MRMEKKEPTINEKGEKLEESVITEIEKYLDGEIEEIPFAKKALPCSTQKSLSTSPG